MKTEAQKTGVGSKYPTESILSSYRLSVEAIHYHQAKI